MPPDKSSVNGSSPACSQRSNRLRYTPTTPRKPPTNRENAGEDTPSSCYTKTPRSVTRSAPQPLQATQTTSSTVNIHNSAQPEPRPNHGRIRSPSFEIQSQLESEPEKGEDNDDHADRFAKLLSEAKDYFTNQEPEFLIKFPGEHTRVVEIANHEIADLNFEYWDKTRGKGFWTLEIANQGKHIVKSFSKGRQYQAWLGLNEHFDGDPIAWQKGSSPKDATEGSASSAGRAEDSSTVASEEWEASDHDATMARSLRERVRSQLMPYTAEKFNHKRALQGKLKRDGDFDHSSHQLSKTKARQVPQEYDSVKKRRTSSKSDSHTLTPPRAQKEPHQENVYKQTRLNTRLISALSGLSEVIYLEDALTVDAFFAEVREAWQSKITGGSQLRLAVNFPWLEGNNTSSALSVRQDRPRSFDRMLEVIKKAPCWLEEGDAECVVDVHIIID